ncbi:serine/threonine-protein phosphatase 2A regulatory subunit B'' subunit alpha isoform X2 [Condylostylus longicornis]|uniref:serine/threonine-protein phosphatase 2A regulatory subunit B'' subunit alpha isoform X2 n=1 Tax=Condylostylus longicornis TaxID=2530218 RepID=UPI00244E0751|nr:serine/threonine-protein phosphatase 2A regulatory subunit B'' subunit alpha isoform X2 [Condylostylus longicornis]
MAKAAKQQEENIVPAVSISKISPSSPSTALNLSSSFSEVYYSDNETSNTKNYDNRVVDPQSLSPTLKHHLNFWQNKKRQGRKSNIGANGRDKRLLKIDSAIETDEDIESIAKQISDHAEIIYQNWKARGLAPTEIFDCQISTNSLRFLQSNFEYPISEYLINSPDMSNNNLNKLVSSFINEDKARQLTNNKKVDAAAVNINTNTGYNTDITEGSNNKRNSLNITSGTIRDTLRKFESINTSSNTKPNFLTTKQLSSLNSNISVTSNESYKANNFQKISKSYKNVPNETEPETKPWEKSNESLISSESSKTISVQQLSNGLPGPQSVKPRTPVKPKNLLKHLNQNQESNEDVKSSSSSLLSASGRKTSVISSFGKQQSPNQNLDNGGKVVESVSNSNAITNTMKSSTVLENKQTSTQRQNETECKLSEKKSIVSTKQQNNYSLPTLPTSSPLIDSMSREEQLITTQSHKNPTDLLVDVIREEEHLLNSLKCVAPQNKSDSNVKIDKKNKDLKHKVTAQHQYIKNIKNENIVQPSIASKEKKNNVIEERGSQTLLNNNNVNKSDPVGNTSGIGSVFNKSKSPINIETSQFSTATTNRVEQSEKNDSVDNILLPSMKLVSSSNIVNNKTDVITKYSTIANSAPKPSSTRPKMRSKNDAVVQNNANTPEISKINKNFNPVQPFLARGSVAERIMMFEKCPDVIISPFRNVNKDTQLKPKLHAVHAVIPKSEPQSHTTLQRAVRASNAKSCYIPRFHYPHGKPLPNIAQETIIQQVKAAFDAFPNNQCGKQDFHKILKLCNVPFYWRMPFISCSQIMSGSLIDGYRFVDFWKQMSVYCHDSESKFVYILSRGQRSRPFILPEDLTPLVQDVVDTHPGLAFLKEASEFHSRYIHTVISRIFYTVNRSWSNRITVSELRRSNLLQVIQLLENEEDINQIMAFFSYEHFYVIYCKFWELDRDHDLFIDQNDLAQHNNHALSTRIIERIFSGCVTRGEKNRTSSSCEPKMSYTDFVWFLLSEEDKSNPTSIEYWFRCMDLDGDGVISMYELEYFYEEQQERMFSLGIETLPFEDCLCQMLDMIKPKKAGQITLGDLKRCKMTSVFFDTFFNLVKYLEYEQRDPFASQKENDDMTDWDRYAAQEYELLVAEENDAQGEPEKILTYNEYLKKKQKK